MPGTFGFHDVDLWLPPSLNLALTGLGLIAIIRWATRSPQRGLIATALGLILGGYALTYPFRNRHGAHWLFQSERFHLFPQLGLVVLIALVARRWLSRFDRRPLAGLVVATGLAVLLLGSTSVASRTWCGPIAFPNSIGPWPPWNASVSSAGPGMWHGNSASPRSNRSGLTGFNPSTTGCGWPRFPPGFRGHPTCRSGRYCSSSSPRPSTRRSGVGWTFRATLSSTEDLVGASPDCVAVGRLVETDNAHCGQFPSGWG